MIDCVTRELRGRKQEEGVQINISKIRAMRILEEMRYQSDNPDSEISAKIYSGINNQSARKLFATGLCIATGEQKRFEIEKRLFDLLKNN